jgi:UDP-glucose 4-epimerase
MNILAETDHDLRAALRGARVLVTGGTGFIGGHLTAALLEAGADVVRVDRNPERGHPALMAGGPPLHRLDVGSASFREFLRRVGAFDYIFHLAGHAYAASSVSDPLGDFTSNLVATIDLLEELRAVRYPGRLVFASSAAVYGNPIRVPIEASDSAVPISPYGVSKLAAERYVAVYARLYDLPAASLRLFSVYGPGQTKQVVYDLLTKLQASPRELHLLGDGTQVRDFVYVADVARAFIVVAVRGRRDGAVYNVASGIGTSTADLARTIVDLQGADAALTFAGAVRAGDPERWVGDNRDLAALGGAPRVTLRDGLRATAAWFNATVGRLPAAHEVAR